MNITPHQARAVTALCETGTIKGVCFALGQKRETVVMILYRARLANNLETNIHLALAWDRYTRGRDELQLPLL